MNNANKPQQVDENFYRNELNKLKAQYAAKVEMILEISDEIRSLQQDIAATENNLQMVVEKANEALFRNPGRTNNKMLMMNSASTANSNAVADTVPMNEDYKDDQREDEDKRKQ
ncbi:unnamed protein product, partial [Rotaria sp. Silwood1]